jgi:DNA-binding transcriptional LysR family regulator
VSTEPDQAAGPAAGAAAGPARGEDIARVPLPNMERIRSFVVVAEELHFGRAAARLHLTQPPLSRQVMLLEQEVGVPLLDRSGRGVRLTPAGRVFLAEARRILRLAEESTLAVRRVPAGDGGTLAVGFTAVSVHGYVQSFLRRVGERLPHVDLVLRELVTAGQVEAIAAGDLDLGFARPPVSRASLASRVVHTERLLLAVSSEDPLAARPGPADAAELDGRALVMYSPVESRYFYELLTQLTAQAGARPRYVQYVSQVHTLLALVQAGLGLAVVPESAAALHPDGVAFVPLADGQSPPVELAAVWRADFDNPVLARALDLLPLRRAALAAPAPPHPRRTRATPPRNRPVRGATSPEVRREFTKPGQPEMIDGSSAGPSLLVTGVSERAGADDRAE